MVGWVRRNEESDRELRAADRRYEAWSAKATPEERRARQAALAEEEATDRKIVVAFVATLVLLFVGLVALCRWVA